MHELPLVKSIFKSVISAAEKNDAKKVTKVVLEIGRFRDVVPEIVEKYWSFVTKGSLAEDSQITINEIPGTVKCQRCNNIYAIDPMNLMDTKCPSCGCEYGDLLTGKELKIKGIEIE